MGVVVIHGYVVDGTHGGKRGIWKEFSVPINKFINKEKVSAIKLDIFAGKKKIKLPPRFPGIPEPHLHYGGKLFPVTQSQWNQFSGMVIKDLQAKLNRVKTVGIDELSAISSLVSGMRG